MSDERRRSSDLPSRSCAALQCLCRSTSGAVFLVHRISSSALTLADLAPEASSSHRAEGIRSNAEAIHSWASTLPQGFSRDPSSAADVRVTVPGRRCPSPGVPFPSAITSAKEPYSPGGSKSPAPCVFRVRSSLDALLPFAPSNPLGSGRSWDFPFRAFLLPGFEVPFGDQNPPDVVATQSRCASSTDTGPDSRRGS
jgi:hypothetical protein